MIRWLAAIVVLYWCCLFAGTHWPGSAVGGDGYSDKFLHFGAFAGLAVLLALAFGLHRRRSLPVAIGILLLVAGYGMVDELLQIPVPGRFADMWDWVADATGAAAGTALVAVAGWWRGALRAGETPPTANAATGDTSEASDQDRMESE